MIAQSRARGMPINKDNNYRSLRCYVPDNRQRIDSQCRTIAIYDMISLLNYMNLMVMKEYLEWLIFCYTSRYESA